MSRAFTKEGVEQDEILVPPRASLPDGVPNYVTASGMKALRAEHVRLVEERHLAEAGDNDDPNRTRLLTLASGRLAALELRLASAEVVGPPEKGADRVRFGASVVFADTEGTERSYRIVGVDEADADNHRLAFISPLAKALLGHRVGDEVVVRMPRGKEKVEILRVEYARDE